MKKYDNYKDSGIEWIGEIPNHWEVILFKRIVYKIKDGTHGTFQRVSDGHPFLSAKNVYDDGVRIGENESYISESDYLEITKNGFPQKEDLLITCVGTIGRTFVYNFDESMAFQRSVTFIRFNNDINPQFYKFYVQSSIYQNLLISLAKTSAQSGIYMGDLMNTTTLKIPFPEQTTIANYLDHKTIQIDTLIAKKEQFINLLQEERTAVINQAVTKGLDPKVKMKDSGIEWLGEIPEHWEVKKLKFISKITRGAILRPVDEPSYFDDNGEWTYLNISDATICDKYLDFGKLRLSELGSTKSARVEPNNLIITASATIGKPFINKIPVCVHDGFIPITELQVNIDFLYNYFKNPQLFNGLGKSNTQKNIYLEDVKNLIIPIPSIEEQLLIAKHIEEEIEKIETLISKTLQEIELLKEYKTALISEVVTGKVDVRDVVLN